jgi:hypothetical protein
MKPLLFEQNHFSSKPGIVAETAFQHDSLSSEEGKISDREGRHFIAQRWLFFCHQTTLLKARRHVKAPHGAPLR